MNKVLIHIILCFILFPGNLSAQYNSFRNYSLEDGLPQSQINTLFQDERNNLWIGTNGGGLCRYTGKGFEVFTRKNGLSGDVILDINEKRNSDLIIKTTTGISVFNGIKFTNYPAINFQLIGSSRMYRDGNDHFWFLAKSAGGNKQVIIQFSDSVYVDFTSNNRKSFNDKDKIIIGSDKDNHILICQGDRIFAVNGSSLSSFNVDRSPQFIDKTIVGLYCDNNGYIWFFTQDEQMKIEAYRYKGKELYRVHFPARISLPGINSFYEDRDGNIWIGNPVAGELYEWIGGPGSRKVEIYTTVDGIDISSIKLIRQDIEGNIWFGTDGKGLYKYGGTKFISFLASQGMDRHFIWSISQDDQDNYWFGTAGEGLLKYDGKKLNFYPSNDNKIGFIHSIIPWGNTLLLGCSNGLWEFDGQKYAKVNAEFGLPEQLVVSKILKLGDDLWIGTHFHGAYNTRNGSTRNFNVENSELPNNECNYFLQDHKGNIWIATRGGLCRYDGNGIDTFNPSGYFGFTSIEQLTEDPSGQLWAATYGDGVYRIKIDEHDSLSLNKYGTDEGLSSNNVYSILSDKEGNIWAGCQLGADRLSLDSKDDVKEIRNYDNYEGFTGLENNANANYVDKDGKLWFGTIKGVMVYNPEMDHLNTIPPKTNITGVKLFNKEVDWESAVYNRFHKHLTAWTRLPLDLKLPYNKNNLSFTFEGVSYTAPEKVKFQWKLKGIDKDWSPVSSKNEATYTNLPPGNYTFQVRAGNNDGVWNEYPLSYSFIIRPPFWGTWWFRGVVLFFMLTFGLVIIGLRNKFIQEKREELEVLVAFKTNKLEKQKNEIIHSNTKLVELNNEKNNIISIVAHDLKNPLTSALTMASILKTEGKNLGEDQLHCIEIIEKSMNRMNDMINRLLDIKKIENKLLELKLEKVNLREIIHEVNRNLQSEILRKRIKLSLEAEEVYARVDPEYTTQVFENLLSNAIKFSPPERNVRIRMIKNNGKARTEFIDEGPGLTEEDKKKIFGKFQRLSARPTAGEHSTGLGLSIVKKYVEAMEGKVWCESEYGKGANFIVEFIRLE